MSISGRTKMSRYWTRSMRQRGRRCRFDCLLDNLRHTHLRRGGQLSRGTVETTLERRAPFSTQIGDTVATSCLQFVCKVYSQFTSMLRNLVASGFLLVSSRQQHAHLFAPSRLNSPVRTFIFHSHHCSLRCCLANP